MPNRSALKQLLIHFHSIFSALDNNQQVDTVMLDIKKAFDSVSHQQLLLKLWEAGVTGSLWLLFRSYLSDRYQCVKIDSHISNWLPVCSGVPQGSILGPLLFVLYINDLPSYLQSTNALLFADDTMVSKVITFSDCSALQKDLIYLSEWCISSKLSFNANKCSLIRFSTNSTPFEIDYLLCGSQLKVANSCRDLGIIVSDNLSWSDHYKFISSKAYSQLSLVKRCFINASTSFKKLLYISLVRSKITYCSQLWRPMLIKDILCIERIQQNIKINDYNKSTYKKRLISLNLLPLMYLYELNDVLFY